MSKKHKKSPYNSKVYWTLSCLASTISSLVGAPIGITSSAKGLQICAIAAVIKKYNYY